MQRQKESENRRILIIGASTLQLPAVLKAKEMGFYVGVVDYNPKAIGIKYADEYFNVSTIDVEGVTEVAKSFKPDGIMTLATDMPMRAIAMASKACGLPGISYETAIMTTDKVEMIKAFELNGVDHPWYLVARTEDEFNTITEHICYPCVIKPTDNAGSRGVVLVNNQAELEDAYHYACGESRSGSVIIEEYLEGSEFSIEIMVIDGNPSVIQITDKLTDGAPHFVEMGHSQPSSQNEDNLKKVRALAIKACKAVGINIGPAHVEIILTKDGPKMVELGARLGGDFITTHLVPLSTGIDMIKATIELACGELPDLKPKTNKGAAIRYFKTSKGILKAVEGISEAKKIQGIKVIEMVKEIGEKVGEIGSSVDRIGFVIAQANTAKNAVGLCEKAINEIKILVEPE